MNVLLLYDTIKNIKDSKCHPQLKFTKRAHNLEI